VAPLPLLNRGSAGTSAHMPDGSRATNNADCVSPVPNGTARNSSKRYQFNRSRFRRLNGREIGTTVRPLRA
jgi:hypothetical protein